MRVRFVRSGGFAAAMKREYTADSASMPADEAGELTRLIEAADFFQIPTAAPGRASAARDAFHYSVSIEEGERKHTVSLGETSVPDEARPLIDWLVRRASPPGGR